MSHVFRMALLALALCSLAVANAAGHGGAVFPVSYCVYDLGGGGVNEAGQEIVFRLTDMNNLGQVAGVRSVYPEPSKGFVWSPARGIRWLGTLPGDESSEAVGINDAGVVVGQSALGDVARPFVWDARRGMRPLNVALGTAASAADINLRGQTVGTTTIETDVYHGYRRERNGAVTEIPAFGRPFPLEYSYAFALNDSGTVVGISSGSDRTRPTEGYIWSEALGIQPLSSPDQLATWPRAINNRGEVVGGGVEPDQRAFIWTQASGLEELGWLPDGDTSYAEAFDINDWGTAVGTALTADLQGHAFVWRRHQGMQDLNALLDPTSALAPHVIVHGAVSINNLGWIAAQGRDVRTPAGWHGFILVPRWRVGVPRCD